MSYNYTTDDNHILSNEDFIFNVRWKVNELKQQRESDDYILHFDDCCGWYEYADIFLEEIKKQTTKNP